MPEQLRATPTQSPGQRPSRPVNDPGEDFGSNQDRLAHLRQTGPGTANQGPTAPGVGTPGPGVATAGPAAATPTLDRTKVGRPLRSGANGDEVKALQAFLGFEGAAIDGDFGPATRGRITAWQKTHGLKETGALDTATLAAMRGDKQIYGYSNSHDPDKFSPTYAMTAYHESGIYRKKDDPYAVGAITRPNQDEDDGGKTYGTYQFESYVYRDGTMKKGSFEGSTLMRFVNWADNPYGVKLKAVVKDKGVASAEFDALWSELSSKENKAFGAAQEKFLEKDVGGKVDAFLTKAGADGTQLKDPRLRDLAMGTLNQYGGLANSHAQGAADAQAKAKRKLSTDELGRAIQDHKAANVKTNFSRSPKAQPGVSDRIKAERSVFPGK
jgi:peptidoglycan hydrolase-like protein with peptidoglycan-binding domain